jgi:hypothetical protein
MEVHEALFTFVMVGSCATACLGFAFVLGSQDWELFAAIAMVYFVFTFIGYMRAYGENHYGYVH